MNTLNPILESQIDALTEICSESINRTDTEVHNGFETDFQSRVEPLLRALMTGGYARISEVELQVQLEARTLEQYPDIANHRSGELTAITRQIQRAFDTLVHQKSTQPSQEHPSQE